MALWKVDRRIPITFFILLTISLVGTILSVLVLATNNGVSFSSVSPSAGNPFSAIHIASVMRTIPVPLSLASWTALAGVFFIWRGRTRSIWLKLGFDQDVFKLFIKMRGAPTRLKLLQSLSTPKDRTQLAQDIGIDWKAVDRHVELLEKYGFVKEKSTAGVTKYYELTPVVATLLRLVEEQEIEKPS